MDSGKEERGEDNKKRKREDVGQDVERNKEIKKGGKDLTRKGSRISLSVQERRGKDIITNLLSLPGHRILKSLIYFYFALALFNSYSNKVSIRLPTKPFSTVKKKM